MAAERVDASKLLNSTAAWAPPTSKTLFKPTTEWQVVPKDAVCPAGLDFRIDFETGLNYARLSPRPGRSSSSSVPSLLQSAGIVEDGPGTPEIIMALQQLETLAEQAGKLAAAGKRAMAALEDHDNDREAERCILRRTVAKIDCLQSGGLDCVSVGPVAAPGRRLVRRRRSALNCELDDMRARFLAALDRASLASGINPRAGTRSGDEATPLSHSLQPQLFPSWLLPRDVSKRAGALRDRWVAMSVAIGCLALAAAVAKK